MWSVELIAHIRLTEVKKSTTAFYPGPSSTSFSVLSIRSSNMCQRLSCIPILVQLFVIVHS